MPEIPTKINGDDPKVKSKKYVLRALKSQRKDASGEMIGKDK